MTSYQLSRRGWISVEYAQWLWIPCPPMFPEGFDRDSWASLYARQWWWQSGREHGQPEVELLASTLAGIHDYAYEHLPMQRGFIHFPEITVPPLLVSFGIWEATGDPTAQLRALVHADEPEAIEPADVTELATEALGTGLKSLSYTRTDQTITAHLDYAWRSEEHATALRMFTASPDLGRLQRAVPDIEQLARGVAIVPTERDTDDSRNE
jgi:hypothetical protein